MRRKIAITIVGAALALVTIGAAPPSAPLASPLLVLDRAAAAPVTKSLDSGGGGNVGGAGDRLGDLLSGWGVPVLIALAGILLVGTLTARNIGASVGIVLITLIGLIFLLAPQSIETAAKGIAGIVF